MFVSEETYNEFWKEHDEQEQIRYYIRRVRDNRLIAGLFVDIKTEDFAKRVLAEWEHNCPDEEFYIDLAKGE